uniref:M_domain domain-containing protein n=1 Tax=Angiostrongylus cantonensis TaxID=6313 RepID=A0A0K0DNA6_ANGCA
MPGSAPPPPPANEGNAAWEKAQQALKKIVTQTPSSTGITQTITQPPPAPPPNAHALMMQYYPWIAQYGMQYPPPPNYVMGYQQQSYVTSSNSQQWNSQKPWNNTKQWNNRPPQQKKQPQSQTPKKFTPFSLPPRLAPDNQRLTASAPSVASSQTPGGLGVMPDNVNKKDGIERDGSVMELATPISEASSGQDGTASGRGYVQASGVPIGRDGIWTQRMHAALWWRDLHRSIERIG